MARVLRDEFAGADGDEGSWRDAALRVEKDVPKAWTLFNLKRIIHTRTTQTDGPRSLFRLNNILKK